LLSSLTGWALTGNAIDDSTDFLGSTNTEDLVFKTDNVERLRISSTGSYDTTLGLGILHSDASGILSSSAVDLASGDVTGILPVANGGTGLDGSSAANGSLLIGNGTGFSNATLTGTADQVIVTDGAGTITLSTPQDIATTSSPSFDTLTVTNATYGTMNVAQELASEESTGVRSGGILSVNADPTKFDLTQFEAVCIDNTNPAAITRATSTCGPFTAETVTNLGTQPITFLLADSSCTLIQQATAPTPAERRQYAFVGRINHSNLTDISFANSTPDLLISPTNQMFDLFDALGPFNVSGNVVSANGANLSINKSAGFLFQRAANYSTDNQAPNTTTNAGLVLATFRRATQTTTGTDVTTLDVVNYDVAGTVTAIPGGVNTATVQRVYVFRDNSVRVQYGQNTFVNLAAAIQGFQTVPYIINPSISGFGVLIAYVAVQKNCTSLQDTACSRILISPRFGDGFGASSGGGTTTLQQAYLNSVQPQIVLNSTQGGLQIDDAATPIGSSLLAIRNNAGTTSYLDVDVNGISTTNFVGSGTLGAVRVHNLTTTEKNALTPAAGMIVYDTDLARFEGYSTSWGRIGGGAIEVSATQSLAAAATITLAAVQRQRVKIKSTGGSVAVLLPNGTLAAQEVYVQGDDSDNPCTIVNGGNVASNGEIIFLKHTNYLFIWDIDDTKWVVSGGY
jgi:hypothetical protein